jgi:hypothetical protein
LLLPVAHCWSVVTRIQSASKNLLAAGRPSGRSPAKQGAVAQLGERLICIQEVAGSIPTSSTSFCKTRNRVSPIAHRWKTEASTSAEEFAPIVRQNAKRDGKVFEN